MNAFRIRLRITAWLAAVALLSCGSKSTPAPARADTTTTGGSATAPVPATKPETLNPVKRKEQSLPESGSTGVVRHPPELPTEVLKVFPNASVLRSLRDPFPCQLVGDRAGKVLGYVVDSDSTNTTATGYAGPVPVRVYLDTAARPRRIYVLDNRETPAYLDIIVSGGLLDRLLEYEPARPESIDAVTLATCSSRAIIAGVTATARRVLAEIVQR